MRSFSAVARRAWFRIAFEPDWQRLAPFDLTGPALMRVGIVPLITVSAITAYSQRSWGLAYLTAASGFGLVASVLLQSALPVNDARILFLASATAAFAAVAGTSSLMDRLHGRQRNLAIAVGSVSTWNLADGSTPSDGRDETDSCEEGFAVGQPVVQGPGYPYVGQTRLRKELDKNWDFYAWIARALPNDTRLLTPYPVVAAGVAGVASPTSGRRPANLGPTKHTRVSRRTSLFAPR